MNAHTAENDVPRCGCGADVVSLNPAEVVVHNWGGGPCRIVPTSVIPPAKGDQ